MLKTIVVVIVLAASLIVLNEAYQTVSVFNQRVNVVALENRLTALETENVKLKARLDEHETSVFTKAKAYVARWFE